MIKQIFNKTVLTILLALTIFSGCASNEQPSRKSEFTRNIICVSGGIISIIGAKNGTSRGFSVTCK